MIQGFSRGHLATRRLCLHWISGRGTWDAFWGWKNRPDELGDSEFRCDFCSSFYYKTTSWPRAYEGMHSMLVSLNANPVAWSILTFSCQVSDSEVSLGAAWGTTEHGSVELLLCRIYQTPRNGMECRENWKNAKRVGQSICISRNRVKSLLNFNQWLSIKPTKV